MRGVGGRFVVVVVLVGVLSCDVADDAVEQVVGNGFCHCGWWRWVEKGYIVVGFSWSGVKSGRVLQDGWIIGIDVFIHDDNCWCGADEADGLGGEHVVDRGGVRAEAGGEGAYGGCHGGPVGWCGRRCVGKTVESGN